MPLFQPDHLIFSDQIQYFDRLNNHKFLCSSSKLYYAHAKSGNQVYICVLLFYYLGCLVLLSGKIRLIHLNNF